MIQIKDIPNYEGKYAITEDGRVFSYPKRSNKYGKWLKQQLINTGYMAIILSHKHYLIHRLVALTFIPNPNNKPCVNHIDGNKLNNSINNLEWCTYSENHLHAYKNNIRNGSAYGKFGKDHHLSKPVLQYSLSGILVGEYNGITEASRNTNIQRPDIGACCNGRLKSAGKYIWRFKL